MAAYIVGVVEVALGSVAAAAPRVLVDAAQVVDDADSDVSGHVAWHISCTIVCTNGIQDLLDLGIAGACADDVGQLCHSCTSKCSYMGVACRVNMSSGDVFEIGVAMQLSVFCKSGADGELGWRAGRADCCGWRVQDPPCDLCQEEVSVRDGTWWKVVVGAE